MASYGLTTSESFVSESSSDDEGWEDDVAEDLNTFVRLSKAGLFKRADEFYHLYLEKHAGDFAVAAQYAENLIEQRAFGSAEEFLTEWRLDYDSDPEDEDYDDDGDGDGDTDEDGNTDEDEKTIIIHLLLSHARIYTGFKDQEAARAAVGYLRRIDKVLIAEDMSPLKLQTIVISLRIIDVVSRMSQSSPIDDYHLARIPFTLGRKFRPDSTWEEAIIALLENGHIWEANTLLAIHLRHARPIGSDLLKIVDAVPDESDTMYDLVRLTMLVLSSRFLLRQSWQVLEKSGVFDRCEDCAQKLRLSSMEVITDPISSSRAYQDFRLLSLEVGNKRPRRGPGVSWRADDVLKSIYDQGDYMPLLVSREYGVVPVPRDWLKDTGVAEEAIEYLHSRDKDWKATSRLAEKDLGSGPSSLQDDRHGVEHVSVLDSSGRQRSAMELVMSPVNRLEQRYPGAYNQPRESLGLPDLSNEDREQLGEREQPGNIYNAHENIYSAHEAKTTRLSSADCSNILQKAYAKIELCQRYLRIAQYNPTPERNAVPSKEAYKAALRLHWEWQDDPDVKRIFEKSFLQEAEDELRKLNSFDKGSFDKEKLRKRSPFDDASLAAKARNSCNEVVELVATCKNMRKQVEAVLDSFVGLATGAPTYM